MRQRAQSDAVPAAQFNRLFKFRDGLLKHPLFHIGSAQEGVRTPVVGIEFQHTLPIGDGLVSSARRNVRKGRVGDYVWVSRSESHGDLRLSESFIEAPHASKELSVPGVPHGKTGIKFDGALV